MTATPQFSDDECPTATAVRTPRPPWWRAAPGRSREKRADGQAELDRGIITRSVAPQTIGTSQVPIAVPGATAKPLFTARMVIPPRANRKAGRLGQALGQSLILAPLE